MDRSPEPQTDLLPLLLLLLHRPADLPPKHDQPSPRSPLTEVATAEPYAGARGIHR
jgi:hypothetical protein